MREQRTKGWACVQGLVTLSVCISLLVGCSGGGSNTSTVISPSVSVSGQGSISAAGGTITVTDPTSPIVGATVVVPPGATASGTVQISITHQDTPPGPLLPEAVTAGALVVSKTIVLTKDRPGTFDQPIQVTVPYAAALLDSQDIPSVLYWDESTNSYDAMTVTDFNPATGTVTFQTAHFSMFLVVSIKELGKQFLTSSSPIIVDTKVRPPDDGFQLQNVTSYSAPNGNCLGMSSYVDWFFEDAKYVLNGGIGLFNKYNKSDDTQRIIATELIVRAHAVASQRWVTMQEVRASLLGELVTGLSLIQNMKLTMKPQIFIMASNQPWLLNYNPALRSWAHAVVVYSFNTDKTFSLYDPNQPGDLNFKVQFGLDGFTGISTNLNGTYVPAPNIFAYDSYHSVYSPSDMRALFDGAQAGWNEGQFGKIAVESNTTLAFDSTGQAAMVASGNAVHLKGTVTPQGGVQGSEPNQMTVLLAGSKIGTFQVTATPFSFDIPLPTLPAVANQKSTEVLMVAWRGDPNPGPTTPVGNNTRAIYGTFRRFEISVAPITTVAGTGVYGFNGLAGRAIDVQLSQPIGVAVDTTGNLYIGDYGNHLVRKVDALTGSLTTVAGSGRFGIGGDGGPAINAQLTFPGSVVVDGVGNLYIADEMNGLVRKVEAQTGIITTVVTGISPQRGFIHIGMAVDGAGDLYFSDPIGFVRKMNAQSRIITTVAGTGVNGFSGDGGPAISAQLGIPAGLVVDGVGNLYIGDQLNSRVRKVDAQTGIITTVAGGGDGGDGGLATSAQLAIPISVTVDRAGNLYIADINLETVRKVDAQTGIITTVAGTRGVFGFSGDGGPAISAQLHSPTGITLDTTGNLYIADLFNNRVRKVGNLGS